MSGWTQEQLEMLKRVRAFTPEQRAEALKATRASFTPADLAEIKVRQRESTKVIDRLAATETLEQQQQLADQICPRLDAWIRGRNRIQAVRRTRTRPAARQRICARTRGGGQPRARRTAASRAGPDSDSDSDGPGEAGPLEHSLSADWRRAHTRARSA